LNSNVEIEKKRRAEYFAAQEKAEMRRKELELQYKEEAKRKKILVRARKNKFET
jgi:hypothetical protein